jgi:sugar/nucleoside kinase (ribokinase family)
MRGLVDDLRRKMRCERVLVTRGNRGVELFAGESSFASPSLASKVVDRIGSGDAVLALTSACVAAGVPDDAVAFIANVVGAQNVQIVGNASSTEKIATYKFIEALLK